MTSDLNRRICAALVLRKSFPEAEIERLNHKAALMRTQGGKLTSEQQREDELNRRMNEHMAQQAIQTLEETK